MENIKTAVGLISLLYCLYVCFRWSMTKQKVEQPKWWEGYAHSRMPISLNAEIEALANLFESVEEFINCLEEMMGKDEFQLWCLNSKKRTVYDGLVKMDQLLKEGK